MNFTRHGAHLYCLTHYRLINCYLLLEDDGLTIIDTGVAATAARLRRAAEKLGQPVRRIVLTHAHPDHVGGLDALHAHYPDAEVVISARDARLLAGDTTLDANEPQARIRGGAPTVHTRPTRLLEDGDMVSSLGAVASPGHTPGHLAFFDLRDHTLIAGDAFQTQGGSPWPDSCGCSSRCPRSPPGTRRRRWRARPASLRWNPRGWPSVTGRCWKILPKRCAALPSDSRSSWHTLGGNIGARTEWWLSGSSSALWLPLASGVFGLDNHPHTNRIGYQCAPAGGTFLESIYRSAHYHPLSPPLKLSVQFLIFGLAPAALAATRCPGSAAIFGSLALLNLVSLQLLQPQT